MLDGEVLQELCLGQVKRDFRSFCFVWICLSENVIVLLTYRLSGCQRGPNHSYRKVYDFFDSYDFQLLIFPDFPRLVPDFNDDF